MLDDESDERMSVSMRDNAGSEIRSSGVSLFRKLTTVGGLQCLVLKV